MHSKWIRLCAIITALVIAAPIAVSAQEGRRHRSEIQVLNDYDDRVEITLWTERHEEISKKHWFLEPDERVWLADMDNVRIRVRGSDKIKVGEDWGRVRISEVARYRDGAWFVRVRDIWRATHHRRY